jgi:hypothetical protein
VTSLMLATAAMVAAAESAGRQMMDNQTVVFFTATRGVVEAWPS